MTKERMNMIEDRGSQIVKEVCLKVGIEQHEHLVAEVAYLIFEVRIPIFEKIIYSLDLMTPSKEDGRKCTVAVFTILHRLITDLEILSLQDSDAL